MVTIFWLRGGRSPQDGLETTLWRDTGPGWICHQVKKWKIWNEETTLWSRAFSLSFGPLDKWKVHLTSYFPWLQATFTKHLTYDQEVWGQVSQAPRKPWTFVMSNSVTEKSFVQECNDPYITIRNIQTKFNNKWMTYFDSCVLLVFSCCFASGTFQRDFIVFLSIMIQA